MNQVWELDPFGQLALTETIAFSVVGTFFGLSLVAFAMLVKSGKWKATVAAVVPFFVLTFIVLSFTFPIMLRAADSAVMKDATEKILVSHGVPSVEQHVPGRELSSEERAEAFSTAVSRDVSGIPNITQIVWTIPDEPEDLMASFDADPKMHRVVEEEETLEIWVFDTDARFERWWFLTPRSTEGCGVVRLYEDTNAVQSLVFWGHSAEMCQSLERAS